LGAALAGFAAAFVAALKLQLPNEKLAEIADELHAFAKRAPDAPAGRACAIAARILTSEGNEV
jgi:hypothetical protein